MADEIRMVVVAEDEVDEARALAEASGLSVEQPIGIRTIDPVSAILIGGAVLAGAKFVVGWLDSLRGGVLLDLRKEETVLKRTREIPHGWLLVIGKDGKVTVEVKDAPKDAVERWVSEIISGVLKTVEEIAKAAKGAVGDNEVKEEPATT